MSESDLTLAVRGVLRGAEPVTARKLAERLGVSQPTISRALSQLDKSVLRVGRGRSTRYVGPRWVRGLEAEFPVYVIDSNGRAHAFETLSPAGKRGFVVRRSSEAPRFVEDLPYYLSGLRPSGFLGRYLPARHPELQNADDIRGWSVDATLRYLTTYGWDGVGAFVVGDKALSLYLEAQRKSPPVPTDRAAHYEGLATRLLEEADVGSLAGGEEPKFIAGDRLVKFSPPRETAVGLRVSDLLVAEHLAQVVLGETTGAEGLPSAVSRIVTGATRTFLEVDRFDRTELPGGGRGRRGVVALEALAREFVGGHFSDRWHSLCRQLRHAAVIDGETVETVHLLACFGRLIGNTEMDTTNLSFFAEGERVTGLCPAYDMLPMLLAPRHGNVVSPPLEDVTPDPIDGPVWSSACRAASSFWRRLASDPRVSAEMQTYAAEAENVVARAKALGELLPR